MIRLIAQGCGPVVQRIQHLVSSGIWHGPVHPASSGIWYLAWSSSSGIVQFIWHGPVHLASSGIIWHLAWSSWWKIEMQKYCPTPGRPPIGIIWCKLHAHCSPMSSLCPASAHLCPASAHPMPSLCPPCDSPGLWSSGPAHAASIWVTTGI
jgi:hypothetical protein